MKYTLKAYTIWELGKRENQEDSLFPEPEKITDSDRLFILCDGMGGHSAGEVASNTVCQAMSQSVLNQCPDAEGEFSDENFQNALADAYAALDTKDDGAAKKMGTTLTFLKLHSQGAIIAHMGDSRVYHIRPGKDAADTKILFQTRDHSLVNDLIKIGELTPEEAKTSRQKNVITRAMQPCMDRRSKADLYHTVDIKPGDYFMLCSDGILENMEDENIQYIFSEEVKPEDKVDMLIEVTKENRDNHTAILVRITDVIDPLPIPIVPVDKSAEETPRVKVTTAKGDVPPVEVITSKGPFSAVKEKAAAATAQNRGLKWGMIASIIIILGFVAVYVNKGDKKETKGEKKELLTAQQGDTKKGDKSTPLRNNAVEEKNSKINTPVKPDTLAIKLEEINRDLEGYNEKIDPLQKEKESMVQRETKITEELGGLQTEKLNKLKEKAELLLQMAEKVKSENTEELNKAIKDLNTTLDAQSQNVEAIEEATGNLEAAIKDEEEKKKEILQGLPEELLQ